MTDGSGSASWTYDARGRTVQESKVISGTGGGTFVTQWGYDSADRPVWMKYPGGSVGQIGEQVNYAHTTQGLLDTVRSNGSTYYVGKTQYNERGQVTERWLGSTTGVVKQQYAYSVAENFRLMSSKAGVGPNNTDRTLNFSPSLRRHRVHGAFPFPTVFSVVQIRHAPGIILRTADAPGVTR